MTASPRPAPRVFTIPASVPFLPTLAKTLLDGELVPGFTPRSDPLLLASATVYLPTRRATRTFAEAILDALGTDTALLPRIVPLGDADEDALAFADTEGMPERPSPVSPAARRLVLAKLVLAFAETTARKGRPLIASSPAAALQLADELARLFDDLTIAGISFDELERAEFVPANLDEYWQKSFTFLKIARAGWEAHLAANAQADPVAWQDQLLALEAKRIETDGGGPVIAAGSTGTIPAVARLIAAIAKRPNGAVVLPGLDRTLDDASFKLIEGGDQHDPAQGHPQYGLKRLIGRIGIARSEVTPLGGEAADARGTLLSEAFRPAITTDRWRERGKDFDALAANALEGISVIEAADPREEALSLAVALRETLETKGASAALITPDRALGRRVAAELRRWKIEVDDSGGVALAESDAGRFARLCVSTAAEDFAPVTLIGLLRHPFTKFDAPVGAIDALEIAALRGPRPAPGPEGLKGAVADAHEQRRADKLHRRDARAKLSEDRWALSAGLAARVADALAPLTGLAAGKPLPFAALVAAHRDALVRLGLDLDAQEPAAMRALVQAFERLEEAVAHAPAVSLQDYADAFPQLLAGEPPVRPPFDRGARIRIFGPLEARLLDADRVLLGGLNEGIWPPETRSDAWLNRPMRGALHLDLPERRIGLAAHDFAQALGTREVVVSRSKKQNGVETVASRFLQRLAAVAPEDAWNAARARGRRYLELAHALERSPSIPAAKRPAPMPPADVRPDRLSVTEIETLVRDPYSIYARHVLRLDPLDEIDADPGAAERGTILHAAFAAFTHDFAETFPANALAELLQRGDAAFESQGVEPGTRAIWWPRFRRAAEWFIGEEAKRRTEIEKSFAEIGGRFEFNANGRTFTLTGRADRIDKLRDGRLALADYKTGEAPTPSQMITGLNPQLALEAAILKAGGFKNIPHGTEIAEITVIRVSGGQPAGEWKVIDVTKARGKAGDYAKNKEIDSPDRLADVSRERLEALIRTFADAGTPYLSVPRPKWRGRFGEYDHLARIKEWSANEEGSD